jgi:hypothetical protein
VKAAIAAIPQQEWQTLADYPEGGEAQIAQTMLAGQRLIVRRTRLLGAQAELWPDWRHHAFLTNRTDAIELVESEHRQHAVVELAIRDLKDQALAHFPSGRFLANAAWAVIAALAHNLLKWTTLIGLPDTVIPDRPDHPPPAAERSWPGYLHRPDSDTPDAGPMALGDRLPHRPPAPPCRAGAHLKARRGNRPDRPPGDPRPRPAQNTTTTTPRRPNPGPRHQRDPIRSTGPQLNTPDPLPATNQAPATPAAHSERWIEA